MEKKDRVSIHYGDEFIPDETVIGKKFILAYVCATEDIAFRTNVATVGDGAAMASAILGSVIAAACSLPHTNKSMVKDMIQGIVSSSIGIAEELKKQKHGRDSEKLH